MSMPKLRERPTKEEVAEMSPFEGLLLPQIVILRSPGQLEDAYRAIERERFVGFDTETKPAFTRGSVPDGPHVIQFALRRRAFIVQVGTKPPLDFLRAIIESQTIVKVGFGLKFDRGPLHRKFQIKLGATVELTKALRSLGYKQSLGAKAAVAVVLGRQLHKPKSITISNWSSPVLQPKQVLYAANDAYAALAVFRAIGSPYTRPGGTTPNLGDATAPRSRS
jgi:ribonuclease D